MKYYALFEIHLPARLNTVGHAELSRELEDRVMDGTLHVMSRGLRPTEASPLRVNVGLVALRPASEIAFSVWNPPTTPTQEGSQG